MSTSSKIEAAVGKIWRLSISMDNVIKRPYRFLSLMLAGAERKSKIGSKI